MPDEKAAEVPMAGGRVTSSKVPAFHLIPTEAMVRYATRCEVGLERKKDKAWNAITPNQEVLTDLAFIYERISHVIAHAQKLRDKIAKGLDPLVDGGDDDAGAILWGGGFLACATQSLHEKNQGKDQAIRHSYQIAAQAIQYHNGIRCDRCSGTGRDPVSPEFPTLQLCIRCGGSGLVGQSSIELDF